MELPDWVLKHKSKGTEVRNLKGRYYLYSVHSVREAGGARPRKVTDKYLGRITEEGVIKPRHERILDEGFTVKEYGASAFVLEECINLLSAVKSEFPKEWREVFSFSVMRLIHNSPIKNLQHHYLSSFLPETLGEAHLSPKAASRLLHSLGRDRERIVRLLKLFVVGSKMAVIDLTHILTDSEGLPSAAPGYNSSREYGPQIKMILVHSLDLSTPVFYRFVPGSISDVSTISLTVAEAGINRAVLIGDKGFHSRRNVEFLEEEGLDYVLPLKRNSREIDYGPVESGDKKEFQGYFIHQRRPIWYYERMHENRRVVTFLDETLKSEEARDYMLRIEKEEACLEDYYEKQHSMGTLSVITNHESSAKESFALLKGRMEIESVIDTFKNTLQADRTYMRDDESMEGWLFINFLALQMHYQIYNKLREENLLAKYSPKDVLMHLARLHKIKIQEEWRTSETPRKTKEIIQKLKTRIT
jgi:transposase